MITSVPKALWPLVLLLAAACGTADTVYVEQRDVSSGQFNGLAIGMSRDRVPAVARALGAQAMSAIPCTKFKVPAGDAGLLPSLSKLEGVRVTDGQSRFEDIYFSEGKVSRVTRTPGSDLLAGTTVGDDVDYVRRKLTDESARGLTIAPIVDMQNGGTLILTTTDSLPTSLLRSHDCWKFEVNSIAPAGALYELEFGQAGLERVLYRRPRVRVE